MGTFLKFQKLTTILQNPASSLTKTYINTTFPMLKLPILFPYLILFFITSCNAQASSKKESKTTLIPLGDTVSQLSNSVLIVFQASNGDYWFGSDTDGVYKFDEKVLTHFSTKNGLSSDRIRGIQEDKHGNMYFSTFAGISKFDGTTFELLKVTKSNSPSENWKLQTDDLWFATLGVEGENGPYRYDGKHLYLLKFPKHYMEDTYFKEYPNLSWSPYDVYYHYKDSKGTIWFGTSNFGICRYDGNSFSWLYEDHLTNTPNGGSFGIRSIFEDSKGKFWFCNTRYRYAIDKDSIVLPGKVLIPYQKEKGIEGISSVEGKDHVYFFSVIEDESGDLWMVTYNEGVWRYNGKEVIHYEVKDGEKNVTLFTIYKDLKGEMWLGTHDSGVFKFNGKEFEKFEL